MQVGEKRQVQLEKKERVLMVEDEKARALIVLATLQGKHLQAVHRTTTAVRKEGAAEATVPVRKRLRPPGGKIDWGLRQTVS